MALVVSCLPLWGSGPIRPSMRETPIFIGFKPYHQKCPRPLIMGAPRTRESLMSRWTAIGRSKANRRAQVKPQAKAIRYGTLLAAAVFAFLSVEVLADPPASTSSSDKESSTESPKATGKFEPFKSESKTSTGSVTVGGQTIAYQAVAGTLIVHPKGWDDVPRDPKSDKDDNSPGGEGEG